MKSMPKITPDQEPTLQVRAEKKPNLFNFTLEWDALNIASGD